MYYSIQLSPTLNWVVNLSGLQDDCLLHSLNWVLSKIHITQSSGSTLPFLYCVMHQLYRWWIKHETVCLISEWQYESNKFRPAFLQSLSANSCTDLGKKTFRHLHKLEPQWKCYTMPLPLLPFCVDYVWQWVIIFGFVYLGTSEIPLKSQRRRPLSRWTVGISQCSCSECCFLQLKQC